MVRKYAVPYYGGGLPIGYRLKRKGTMKPTGKNVKRSAKAGYVVIL